MNYIYGMDFDIFFSIVDNMYDEILIYDKNFNIVYINKACIRHYGCSPEQMIGKSFYDFVHADWWRPSILPRPVRPTVRSASAAWPVSGLARRAADGWKAPPLPLQRLIWRRH